MSIQGLSASFAQQPAVAAVQATPAVATNFAIAAPAGQAASVAIHSPDGEMTPGTQAPILAVAAQPKVFAPDDAAPQAAAGGAAQGAPDAQGGGADQAGGGGADGAGALGKLLSSLLKMVAEEAPKLAKVMGGATGA
ncbi:MAG TPA: hypothetical protein VNE00_18535 [Paraburkholderia sp.]|jgi:hypothetical protein|nr:hypothetical protein [Paraburkholderia sp.]